MRLAHLSQHWMLVLSLQVALHAESELTAARQVPRREPRGLRQSPFFSTIRADCATPHPLGSLTKRLNSLLSIHGAGYVLSLCPDTVYPLTGPLVFTAPSQEITTYGNPTGDSRAILVVNGSRESNGTGHSIAVNGQCGQCSGCKLHHVQINGTRLGHPPIKGGGNIEMGGPNTGQVIEYVKSYDPRSWTCLHAAEGVLNCASMVIRNNEIGPCGLDLYDQWADGISVACSNTTIANNTVDGPTDGGIVVFGSPGTIVERNVVRVGGHTLLGGINLVDYEPWGGNYTGVVVQYNTIIGGFADMTNPTGKLHGRNTKGAMLKVGIAMGPRVWFGEKAGANISFGAIVRKNRFTGGFGYAMAGNGIKDFQVSDNFLFGNTSFLGTRGENCTKGVQDPAPFVYVASNVTGPSSLQKEFSPVPSGDLMICIEPPEGDFWPFEGYKELATLRISRRDLEAAFVLGLSFTLVIGYIWGAFKREGAFFAVIRREPKSISKSL